MAKSFKDNAPTGLQSFSEYFKDHAEHYVLIGGTAVILHHENVGANSPRKTVDLDVVILDLEQGAKQSAFIQVFKNYVDKNKFECAALSDGKSQAFRFTQQEKPLLPRLIEIASKAMNATNAPFKPTQRIEDISLSTMAFQEPYYSLIKTSKMQIPLTTLGNGAVPTVTLGCLVALKLFAYKNLVDASDSKADKHFADLCRLALICTDGDVITVSDEIKNLISIFENEKYIPKNVDDKLQSFGWPKKSQLSAVITALKSTFK
jgi:hypothetical protein